MTLRYVPKMRSLVCTLFAAGWASAALPCDDLLRVADAVRGQDGLAGIAAMDGAQWCSASKGLSGAQSFHCAWGFEFRDAAARSVAQDMVHQVRHCLGGVNAAGLQNPVNHPDTFDQMILTAPKLEITVAVKDKGAQNRTLVFLGVGLK